MRPFVKKKLMRLNNSVDGATSSLKWGKKANHYGGVAGKMGHTTNFEMKDTDRKENE